MSSPYRCPSNKSLTIILPSPPPSLSPSYPPFLSPSLLLSLLPSLPPSLSPSLPRTLPPSHPPSLSPVLHLQTQAGPNASHEEVWVCDKSNTSNTSFAIPLQWTVQYSTVQYSTVQYSTVQYSTVQYSTVQYSTVQYSAVHHSTAQCSTVQYSTVQYSTVQYSTVQHSTIVLAMKSFHLYFLAPITLFRRNTVIDFLYWGVQCSKGDAVVQWCSTMQTRALQQDRTERDNVSGYCSHGFINLSLEEYCLLSVAGLRGLAITSSSGWTVSGITTIPGHLMSYNYSRSGEHSERLGQHIMRSNDSAEGLQ